EEKRKFKEHPDGEFTIRTNSLSLRRDAEATPGKLDLRVLVTGDSHLEGTCNNSENLCSVAEASLKAERPGETIEVLNAGRGGYQLWNYVGILERYLSLDLAPDVFVVMVFGGNDFSGTCQMSHLFEGTHPKSLAPGYREKRQQAIEYNRPVMAQGYNSVLHFRDNPDEAEYTLNQIRRITAYMSTLCEENGVELLFLYLPAPLDLDWEPPFPNAAEMRLFLDISDEVRGVNGRIAADLLEDLSRASIPAVDLTPALSVDPAKHFWEKDLHLSVAGHRVTGELLADAIRELRRG
ncbi:MAG: SGNH/GDSL hydrolase family protein, partial [Planctomycetes bacterium]|nr:SGNH/GDSL hydrolase family protein [Planctomycetota bacterium]